MQIVSSCNQFTKRFRGRHIRLEWRDISPGSLNKHSVRRHSRESRLWPAPSSWRFRPLLILSCIIELCAVFTASPFPPSPSPLRHAHVISDLVPSQCRRENLDDWSFPDALEAHCVTSLRSGTPLELLMNPRLLHARRYFYKWIVTEFLYNSRAQ